MRDDINNSGDLTYQSLKKGTMNPNNAKVFILSVFIAFSITGCATSMKVTPLLGESDCHGMQLNGTIHYTKNIQYLPRTIKSDNGSDAEHSLDFHYEYQVTYGRDYLFNSGEMVPLFNPLTLIGAPIGADDVCIIGKLDILQGRSQAGRTKLTG